MTNDHGRCIRFDRPDWVDRRNECGSVREERWNGETCPSSEQRPRGTGVPRRPERTSLGARGHVVHASFPAAPDAAIMDLCSTDGHAVRVPVLRNHHARTRHQVPDSIGMDIWVIFYL
jgi:hypothetical protein